MLFDENNSQKTIGLIGLSVQRIVTTQQSKICAKKATRVSSRPKMGALEYIPARITEPNISTQPPIFVTISLVMLNIRYTSIPLTVSVKFNPNMVQGSLQQKGSVDYDNLGPPMRRLGRERRVV